MNAIPSATSFSREILNPTTNASGFLCTAHRFQQSLTTVNGTFPSGTTAGWPLVGTSNFGSTPLNGIAGVQQDPALASMAANYLDVRTVACSIRVQCILSALNAQGFIHMAIVPEDLSGAANWQYPTTFSAMERAPFYQKVPLANLINNTPTIALPIMDEGAWRYRNTSLLPTQVGQSFLQTFPASTSGQVQVTMTGVAQSSSTGFTTVVFPYPFNTAATSIGPQVVLTDVGGNSNQSISPLVGAISNTQFTFQVTFANSTSSIVTDGTFNVEWEATGNMTPANAQAYYASIGSAALLSAANVQSVTVPGIETSYGWGVCIIAIENAGTAAGVSPIEIEVIRHYEAIPNDVNGTVVTATKAAPNCPEILTLNKAVQDECGPIAIMSDTGIDNNPGGGGFMANFQKCASWVSGVTGAMSGLHPALSVISMATGAMAGVITPTLAMCPLTHSLVGTS